MLRLSVMQIFKSIGNHLSIEINKTKQKERKKEEYAAPKLRR